jgi:dienelactone hydrolase
MAEEIRLPENEEGYVKVDAGDARLPGNLRIPQGARAVVLFIHGSGRERTDPRNQRVAAALREAGIATLLVDLLTEKERDESPLEQLETRLDIALLAQRVAEIVRWMRREPLTRELRLGFFAASTGAGAAVRAAAELGGEVEALVSCDGRPDLAGEDRLADFTRPTLLIVGEGEAELHFLNHRVLQRLGAVEKEFQQVPGGTGHLEARRERDEVAQLCVNWFRQYLAPAGGEEERRKRKAA